MEYFSIGKFVNTHGLKGEIRIISDFKIKKLVFKKGMFIYIGKEKKVFVIDSYRRHKQYDMVTLEDIHDINDIEFLKGSIVYINKEDLNMEGELELVQNLLGYKVYFDNIQIGLVTDYITGPANDVLVVGEKRILIPYVEAFIEKIVATEKEIFIKKVGGLINED